MAPARPIVGRTNAARKRRSLRDHARVNDTRRSAALHVWPHRLPHAAGPTRLAPRLPTRQSRRYAQAVALKRGGWAGSEAWPAADGAAAGTPSATRPGRPRPVRVDEFPHASAFDPPGAFGTEAYKRFHAILAEAGVPYLLAITPHVSRDYLDPESRTAPADDTERDRAAGLSRATASSSASTAPTTAPATPTPAATPSSAASQPARPRERIDARPRSSPSSASRPPPSSRPSTASTPASTRSSPSASRSSAADPRASALLGLQPTPVWRGTPSTCPPTPRSTVAPPTSYRRSSG